MRLDYVMYALAILSFILTAISLAIIKDQNGNLYVVSTVVLGLLLAIVGYCMRPKIKTAAAYTLAVSTPQKTALATMPQAAVTVETPVIKAPKVEAPPVVVEAPKVEAPSTETPVVDEPQPAAQKPASITVSEVPAMEFTQIRGISKSRANQLKTNGINNIQELANANAAELATKLNVSPKIVKMWIGSAKKQIK
jgi:predicted flap endonuclease-1-like 5' DNA nuclease